MDVDLILKFVIICGLLLPKNYTRVCNVGWRIVVHHTYLWNLQLYIFCPSMHCISTVKRVPQAACPKGLIYINKDNDSLITYLYNNKISTHVLPENVATWVLINKQTAIKPGKKLYKCPVFTTVISLDIYKTAKGSQ